MSCCRWKGHGERVESWWRKRGGSFNYSCSVSSDCVWSGWWHLEEVLSLLLLPAAAHGRGRAIVRVIWGPHPVPVSAALLFLLVDDKPLRCDAPPSPWQCVKAALTWDQRRQLLISCREREREPLTALVLFFAPLFVPSEIFISEHLVTRSLMFGSRWITS